MPKRKVLICDDEPHIIKLIQINLERHNYDVIFATDGKESLAKIISEQPDMIILDSMLPGLDSFKILRAIRKNHITHHIPVIMLTTAERDQSVYEAYHYGADMYLMKPFNIQELLAFVDRIWLRNEEPEETPQASLV